MNAETTYTLCLDDGIELTMRYGLSALPSPDGDCVNAPGEVVRITAPSTAEPNVVLRVQKLCAAFGLKEIYWLGGSSDTS